MFPATIPVAFDTVGYNDVICYQPYISSFQQPLYIPPVFFSNCDIFLSFLQVFPHFLPS